MTDPTVTKIALAGLLHDVGKFAQRAEVPLSAASKGMENTICKPNKKGYYDYRHTLWTNEFFELMANHPHLGDPLRESDSIANLAAFHHKPASKLQHIIQLADWLSSGSDRHKAEEESNDREHYKKVRLHSIFDYLKLDDRQNIRPEFRYELDPLDGDAENCFPTRLEQLQPKEGEKLVQGYGALWDGFREELEGMEIEDREAFSVALLSLLEKYTWCIPSSTMHRPDISLFDHAKTTAAIAAALYGYHEDRGDLYHAVLSASDTTEKFRLLVGDLSGIQNYIFNIKNVGVGGTAKRLRARSFKLSALTDVASHALLAEFGMPLTNLVIASGGKFYLLLPNTSDAGQRIAALEHDFSRWLIKNMNAEIALNIASTPCSCKDMLEFNQVLKRANDGLQAVKERAFARCLITDGTWRTDEFVLKDRGFGEETALCPSCEKFPAQKGREGEIVLCHHCEDDVNLGTDLARANGIQFFKGQQGQYHCFDGYSFSLAKRKEEFSPNAYLAQQFNDWKFGKTRVALRPRPFANYIPTFDDKLCSHCRNSDCGEKMNAKTDGPKFFTCLAEAGRGRKALGVFKADVDNLGLIFINGFRTNKEKSISRITTLSRMLETFFTARLDTLLREEFHDIYTVYAGGDDLLMLGPWEQVLRFSHKMRQEFGEFTCGNPAFTLSAGVAVTKPRLPIYAAIGYAENLLDEAKKQPAIGVSEAKDQLAVLGDVIKWGDFETIQKEAVRLAVWQEEKKVSMGFVRQLLDSAGQFRAFRATGETRHLRFVPMLAYSINRNIQAKEREVIQWAHGLTNLESQNLRNLTYIANYSIQTNRS